MGLIGNKTKDDHNGGPFSELSRIGTAGWGYHSVPEVCGVIAELTIRQQCGIVVYYQCRWPVFIIRVLFI